MSDEPKHYPDVAGKIVFVDLAGASGALSGGVLLEYPEFKTFGERVFLVGRIPEIESGAWAAGTEAGVAWDVVIHYMLFKSREDYEKRAATYKPTLKERFVGR